MTLIVNVILILHRIYKSVFLSLLCFFTSFVFLFSTDFIYYLSFFQYCLISIKFLKKMFIRIHLKSLIISYLYILDFFLIFTFTFEVSILTFFNFLKIVFSITDFYFSTVTMFILIFSTR